MDGDRLAGDLELISFGLSFETNDITNTQRLVAYQTADAAQGFDGRMLDE